MKAVQTAVDMVNKLKEFPERMDYTAIGDTVNTAARLEANAPKGMIYISRAVRG